MIKHAFADALSQQTPPFVPPPPFDYPLSKLGSHHAAAIERAIRSGAIPEVHAYIGGGDFWVVRSSLQDLCAPGHCTFDPNDDCCFIP